MNQEQKQTNKNVIVLLFVLPILLFIVPLVVIVVPKLSLIPKLSDLIEEKVESPNYGIKGLKVYIPSDWQAQGDFFASSSHNCKVVGGTSLYDQSRVERIFLKDELDHEIVTINGIELSYGYKENGTEKLYSYFFVSNGTKYFTLFSNKIDSDEECDSFIEIFERTITFDPEV